MLGARANAASWNVEEIRDGHTQAEAIEFIRAGHGSAALCNYTFERWLLESAELEFWRAGVQQDAA